MAVAATMNNNNTQEDREQDNRSNDSIKDLHEHDTVMPGFRFHPTEEELVEFYLRRKVEGKRFNLELITFLDLYRYDPWELPALAAIGEKEWYFYVPRDRKYRNGDRPNRVTTSGYWKATGADRMIKSENFRSIGLKKTLVFYTGKAPKGIRTSWIMNEYRLPHHETERLQKTEISLCRVYKRAGVEDHPPLPRSIPSKASSSSRTVHSDKNQIQTDQSSSSTSKHPTLLRPNYHNFDNILSTERTNQIPTENNPTYVLPTNTINTSYIDLVPTMSQPEQLLDLVHLPPNNIFTNPNNNFSNSVDDLHRLVSNQQASIYQLHLQYSQNNFSSIQQPQSLPPNIMPWDWNSDVAEDRSKGYEPNPFK